jgi:hypothetical protein
LEVRAAALGGTVAPPTTGTVAQLVELPTVTSAKGDDHVTNHVTNVEPTFHQVSAGLDVEGLTGH